MKYIDVPVADRHAFVFSKNGRPTGQCPQTLKEFVTITHSQANYYSSFDYIYDISPTRGDHPSYRTGGFPYTSPVGSFAPNGYGLYDMAGNVWEWCWDWWASGYYAVSPGSDPRGPNLGSFRVARGGGWRNGAIYCRVAYRDDYGPGGRDAFLGFRSVLPPGQP